LKVKNFNVNAKLAFMKQIIPVITVVTPVADVVMVQVQKFHSLHHWNQL